MAQTPPPPPFTQPKSPTVSYTPPHRSTRPMNLLRRRVSVNKRRHIDDGWDLDLTYITPRIIALGFPALRAGTRWWRNRMEDVSAFMAEKHSTNVRIYNLCVEEGWGYAAEWFGGNAVRYGMIDKHPPPLPIVLACIQDMYAWLRADPKHVVAVHCRAGKGRTGTIIACFLMYCGMCQHGDAALNMFDRARTAYGLAVNLPSQRRTVRLFGELMRNGIIPQPNTNAAVIGGVMPPTTLPSRAMIVCSVSVFGWEGQNRPLLRVVSADVKNGSMVHVVLHEQRGVEVSHSVVYTFATPIVVDGLFGIEIYDNRLGRNHRTAAAWIHTIGAPPGSHSFAAHELDGPHKKFKVKNREIDNKEKPNNMALRVTVELGVHNVMATQPNVMNVIGNQINQNYVNLNTNNITNTNVNNVVGFPQGRGGVGYGGAVGWSGNSTMPFHQTPLIVTA